MRNVHMYANRLNLTMRLGRDFIIPAQVHKSAHNFTTMHASGFKVAGQSGQR